MFKKLYDNLLLAVTLIIMSPLMIAAVLFLIIGYALHRIRNFISTADGY